MGTLINTKRFFDNNSISIVTADLCFLNNIIHDRNVIGITVVGIDWNKYSKNEIIEAVTITLSASLYPHSLN